MSMNAPSLAELNFVRQAGPGATPWPGDCVVHWQSAFGLIIIEVRAGRVLVNGELVAPAVPDMAAAEQGMPFKNQDSDEA